MSSCMGCSLRRYVLTALILPSAGKRSNYLSGNSAPYAAPINLGVMTDRPHAGDLLKEWRQRRRLSQLDLALAAEVSSRHLSFVETGRARPSSEMILRL